MLKIKNLKVQFGGEKGKPLLKAVDNVSLEVKQGESIALVGESGCGKSSLANAVMRLVDVADGFITFQSTDVTNLSSAELKRYREKVQMVFQDPVGSLNPRMSVGGCLSEVCKVHNPKMSKSEMQKRVSELLDMVGLDADYAGRYPHEFSGGQRQRIGIARALAVEPELIIADEPVSALDVSVQVQILNLMKDIQRRLGVSYLFIAHDLAVVRYMCETINVMYLGKIVESGPSEVLFDDPRHPYTEALLSAVPDVEKGLKARESGSDRIILGGDVPSATDDIPGCPFHPRCHRVKDKCSSVKPELKSADGEGVASRKVCCLYPLGA